MRERERDPPPGFEAREEVGDDGLPARVSRRRLVPRRARPKRAVPSALPRARAQLVHADPTTYGEQPRPRGRVASETRERAHRAQERLLHEVLCARLVDERGTQSPHLLVGRVDEAVEGALVAGASLEREAGELVHAATIGAVGTLCTVAAEIVGSRPGPPSDYRDMRCDAAREAISALLDGDLCEAGQDALERHLASCASCRAWQEAAHRLTRLARIQRSPAPRPPASLYEALRAERARSTTAWHAPASLAGARVGLAAVALGQLALSVPMLLLGEDRSAPVHVAHEMGSLDLALALGFLAAVRRPARALGMLSLVGVAALLLVVTAVVDLVGGRTTLLDETPHLAVVAGWLLLWRLAVLAPPSHERPRSLLSPAARIRRGPFLARRLADGSPKADVPQPREDEPARARAGPPDDATEVAS